MCFIVFSCDFKILSLYVFVPTLEFYNCFSLNFPRGFLEVAKLSYGVTARMITLIQSDTEHFHHNKDCSFCSY